jgi:tetratricopeptide (TPR) repeat protein
VAIDREKVLLAAQGFIQRKRYDKAVAEYQKIIQQDPDDARTLLKIGDLQSKMEAHAEAIATYERVGKHYAAQGFALKAIAVYKQIREIIQKHVPNLADRYAHITPQLAELYAQLGLVSDALAAYDEVATQLQRTGQDARAVEVFQQIVALDATNPLPHLRLAEAYSRIRNTDQAIEHFATAAEILLKLKRHEDALKVLERLLHHRAEPAYARRAAEIYLVRGQNNDGMLALAKLQICFQADPKSLETLALLARAFVLIGQPAKSIEVQKELVRIAKDTNNVRVWRENIDKLMLIAPGDEQVQRLASSPPGRGVSSMPAVVSEAPISINDSEIEELSEDDIDIGHNEPSSPNASARPQAAPRMPQFSAPEVEVGAEATVDPNEIYGDYADLDPALHPRRILSDAESFHKLGLYAKAIERLDEGIEVHPQSVPIRRKLRDILYEAGEYARTADEMVTIASILLDNGDAQGSAEELAAVLSFQPDHGPTRQMLLDMGYELPTSQYETIEEIEGQPYRESQSTVEGMELPPGSVRSELDSAPLPSYDLEEVGAEEAMSSPGYDVSTEAYEKRLEAAAEQGGLPSFPMEEQDESPRPALQKPAAEAKPGPSAEANWGASADSVGDALEEAEFFLSRGLLDDARATLEDSLRRVPNHPLLVERLRELDLTITQTTGSSGTRERPLNQPEGEGEQDRAFDIAASLDALDALDSPSGAGQQAFGQPTEQIDVEEVFAKFKAGVRAQVSESDSATHYDLGLAYREMGLFDDAIDEFEVAARDPKRECVCQSMIGMIHRNKGNTNAAIDAFIKGLHAEGRTNEHELSLYYELGDAYESKGNGQEALYYFRKVAHHSPNHEDPRGSIAGRIRALQVGGHRPPMERAVGASDEFDAAFDAAIGTDVKP